MPKNTLGLTEQPQGTLLTHATAQHHEIHIALNKDWATIDPISEETCELLKRGYRILSDPQGYFSALCYAFEKQEGSLLTPRIAITEQQAKALVAAQCPQWKHLPLKAVSPAGWCNGAFRLGNDLLLKIPRAERYERSHFIENQWLSQLRPHVSVDISEPLVLGKPTNNYPWHWSISRWIEGETAVHLHKDNKVTFAKDLANFLHSLWKAPAEQGPHFFEQRFFRGAPLRVYAQESQAALDKLKNMPDLQIDLQIDLTGAKKLWQKSMNSTWQQPPVWVHGDLFPANILIQSKHSQKQRLHAVIDFGSMCIGDPACDLVIAWTFFEKESREAFKQAVKKTGLIDNKTWERARGWALWKALITLAGAKDKTSESAQNALMLIEILIKEDRLN